MTYYPVTTLPLREKPVIWAIVAKEKRKNPELTPPTCL